MWSVKTTCLLQKASNPNAIDCIRCNLAETQEKDFKIAIMSVLKDLKEDMNKSLNEDYESINSVIQ